MNKKRINCPVCGSTYTKNNTCTNNTCILYVAKKAVSFDWEPIRLSIRRASLSGIYRYFRNRFFKRFDMIPTGFPKGQYADIVERMLYGMMGLVVHYVENEKAFEIISGEELYGDTGKTFKELVIALYVDWKVNYPKLLTETDDMLTLWASGQSMKFGSPDEKGRRLLEWTYHTSEEIQAERFDKLHKLEEAVRNMEQDMLHRIVDLRPKLWS